MEEVVTVLLRLFFSFGGESFSVSSSYKRKAKKASEDFEVYTLSIRFRWCSIYTLFSIFSSSIPDDDPIPEFQFLSISFSAQHSPVYFYYYYLSIYLLLYSLSFLCCLFLPSSSSSSKWLHVQKRPVPLLSKSLSNSSRDGNCKYIYLLYTRLLL